MASDDIDQDSMADDWAAAMAEQAEVDEAAASPVTFDELKDEVLRQPAGSPDLDVILDIPVSISMEVGRTSITIRNLIHAPLHIDGEPRETADEFSIHLMPKHFELIQGE
mgnify:CR=1 FL=1